MFSNGVSDLMLVAEVEIVFVTAATSSVLVLLVPTPLSLLLRDEFDDAVLDSFILSNSSAAVSLAGTWQGLVRLARFFFVLAAKLFSIFFSESVKLRFVSSNGDCDRAGNRRTADFFMLFLAGFGVFEATRIQLVKPLILFICVTFTDC